MTAYYGLKDTDGNIVQCGWTSAPEAKFCNGTRTYAGATTWRACYAIKYGSTYYLESSLLGLQGQITSHSIETFSLIHPSDPWGTSSGSCVWEYGAVNSLYAATRVIASGSTVYGSDSKTYTVCIYYVFSITASTIDVNGVQVGNVALYNGNTLIAGSVSKSASSARSISASIVAESAPTIKFVATARTSAIVNWHNGNFFNGIVKNGNAVHNSDVVFVADVASLTFTPSNDSTILVANYGKKHAVAINKSTGVATTSVSYSRHHSTGNYVTEAVSPTSLTNSGTLYVEDGSNVSVSASCLSGYVFTLENGFVSQTSGVESIHGSNTSGISSNIAQLISDASFIVVASTYSISVSISDNPTWGTVYIDSPGHTSKTILPNTTYTFGFVSSRDEYEAPTVNKWYVGGVEIEGNTYTTGSTVTGSIAVTCTLTQNAFPVTVNFGNGGTAVIQGRYIKSSGASMSTTGYLFADGRDYIKVAVTPDAHYEEYSSGRMIDNLSSYAAGGNYCYSLSSSAQGSVTFYFNSAECVIRTANNNPTVCDVSPASQTLRFDSASPVNVYCQIKEASLLDWRVDYFTMSGSDSHYLAEAGGTGQYYYSVSASIISGRLEAVFTPHLVSTANPLTVTKTGNTSFAVAYISVSGTEEQMSGSSWNGNIRENAAVVCRAVPTFGGRIANITSTGIVNPSVTESQISFTMPSNEATVQMEIAEKEKVSLVLCVANGTHPSVAVGKITLTCNQSQSVHEEVDTLSPQTFQIYKSTVYRLTATDSDETYMFAGWYINDSTFYSSSRYIDISRVDLSTKYTAKYVIRGTGTIDIRYGTKSGDSVIECQLPTSSQPFGLVIDTPPDLTNPNRWVKGNDHSISFHVLDDGTSVETVGGVQLTYIWTPVRVEVKMDLTPDTDTYTTVWTYDANNPTSRSGHFMMRDSMKVRLVFTKVQAEGYGRVQALFVDGNTNEMGELSIYATSMLTYYSLGGVAEANCHVGRKAVLAAAPKPGWAFGGWFKFVGGAFVPITDNDLGITVNGAVMTIDQVLSSGLTYYADFVGSDNYVCAWGDGTIPKTALWRSKVYVGSQFFAMRNVRIYSDVYPVGLKLMTATSPNGCFTDEARTLNLVIQDQSPRQIPVMRLEKYFAFQITGIGRINHVCIGSSMEALK